MIFILPHRNVIYLNKVLTFVWNDVQQFSPIFAGIFMIRKSSKSTGNKIV